MYEIKESKWEEFKIKAYKLGFYDAICSVLINKEEPFGGDIIIKAWRLCRGSKEWLQVDEYRTIYGCGTIDGKFYKSKELMELPQTVFYKLNQLGYIQQSDENV